MTIEKKENGSELTFCLAGRLDTATAPQLEAEIKRCAPGKTRLTLDLAALEYLSSAGLRVLLSAHKTMSRQGAFVVRNVNKTVMDVFEMTGFAAILTIE